MRLLSGATLLIEVIITDFVAESIGLNFFFAVDQSSNQQFKDMHGARLASGMIDTVLQLHDAPRAVGRHQFGTAGGNKAGLLGADPLAVFIVLDRVGPPKTAAGPGVFHLDKLHLRQALQNQPWFFGDAAGPQVAGVVIGYPEPFFGPRQSGQFFR